jgi:hypothetical protein
MAPGLTVPRVRIEAPGNFTVMESIADSRSAPRQMSQTPLDLLVFRRSIALSR